MAQAAADPRPPWKVVGLPKPRTAARAEGWRYVVLEEIVDDVALLRRWRWPVADERGHLVWPREEQQDSTATPVSALRDQLYTPNGLQREPRIGDTFAVIEDSAAKPWPVSTRNLGRVLEGRVFDVSAEARLAARLAYQGSVAAVLSSPLPTDEEDLGPARPRRYGAPELTVAPAQRPRRPRP
jgi:hypothetical protein